MSSFNPIRRRARSVGSAERTARQVGAAWASHGTVPVPHKKAWKRAVKIIGLGKVEEAANDQYRQTVERAKKADGK